MDGFLEVSGNFGPPVAGVTGGSGVVDGVVALEFGVGGVSAGFSIDLVGSVGTPLGLATFKLAIGAAGLFTPGMGGMPFGFGVVFVPIEDDALIICNCFYSRSSSAAPNPSVTNPALSQLAKSKAPVLGSSSGSSGWLGATVVYTVWVAGGALQVELLT